MDLLAVIKNRINAEQRSIVEVTQQKSHELSKEESIWENPYPQEAPDEALQHSLKQAIPPQPERYVMPYIDNHGDLVVPFGAVSKYFYWHGGQSLESTLTELNVNDALWIKYSSKPARNN